MWFNLGLLPFSQLRPPAEREKPVVRREYGQLYPYLPRVHYDISSLYIWSTPPRLGLLEGKKVSWVFKC